MNEFLPKGYADDKPKQESDGYLNSWEVGDNRIRIMSNPIMGWEYWREVEGKRKPVRLDQIIPPEVVPPEALPNDYNPDKYMDFFWSFIVWNYAISKIQICTIKQSSIQDGIERKINNEKWGDAKGYDINIIKTVTGEGNKKKTEYDVDAEPHTELTEEQVNAFAEKPINLQALFTSDNPFDEEKVNPDDIKI